ncbi:MAG: tRNA(fMet)-specific endonuclease VapC [Myxococcota bacterium]
MRYLLDTNIVSYALRNRDEALMGRLVEAGREQICTSVLVKFELEFGAHLRASPRLWAAIRGFLGGLDILEMTADDTDAAAKVAADLRKKGRPIGQMDTLIAGHALSRGLTLVTHNTKHFREVDGLAVEDWCASV